jgi:hypothetical protein
LDLLGRAYPGRHARRRILQIHQGKLLKKEKVGRA